MVVRDNQVHINENQLTTLVYSDYFLHTRSIARLIVY